MQFEYDPVKSEANLDKHGIDFDEAQALWDDSELMEFPLEFKGEDRFGVMARHGGSVWVAVFTMCGESIRIISVRRATAKEVSFYDRARNDN